MAAELISPTQPSKASPKEPSIQDLKRAIPARCFERSATTSIIYIVRDVTCILFLFLVASLIPQIDNSLIRYATWATYGFVQGLFFTGLWIIAHECGHQALFNSATANDSFGWALHSFLLVPYFSWKYSHGLHHRYHNNMEKDTAFVPPRESEFRPLEWIQQVFHVGEDTPILSLFFLVGHQLLGWPIYLLFNITAGKGSASAKTKPWSSQSHFDPRANLFTDSQQWAILLSDVGLFAMFYVLWSWSKATSPGYVTLAYGLPYLWVNHWLVAITYLHHNHPSSVHYEDDAWNFREGALSTVDRDFGWIGREIMHGIIEFHVVHHLFTKIPFYHAEEATEAIKPLLGDKYLTDRTPMWEALWKTFTKLKYVRPHSDNPSILVWVEAAKKTTAGRLEVIAE